MPTDAPPPATTIRIPVPAKEEVLAVAASKQGATLQLGLASFKLRRHEAMAIADALVDACEHYATTG